MRSGAATKESHPAWPLPSTKEIQLQIAAPPLSQSAAMPVARPRRKPLWREQYVLVLAGAALGAWAGGLFPELAIGFKPLGDVFISLIKMTITPVIFLV